MSILDGVELMESSSGRDPVHYDENEKAWFFYDETWCDRVGPYLTEVGARIALDHYCRDVLGLTDDGKAA